MEGTSRATRPTHASIRPTSNVIGGSATKFLDEVNESSNFEPNDVYAAHDDDLVSSIGDEFDD